MSLSVGDILRVVAVLQWVDGDIAQNVYNLVIGGSGGPYDEADVVDDAVEWVENMYGELVDFMSDNIDGSEVRVYEFDPTDADWDEVGSEIWVFNPTEASDQLPRGVAALINAKTIDPDVNGKKYLPALTEGDVAAGLLTGPLLTALSEFSFYWLTAFVGSTSGATFVPGIWSPTHTVFKLMGGVVTIPSIAAYQRRRKRGVGI